MRPTILIAFLVVAISSSTYGVDNIFGVEIDSDELHTLKASRVAEEIVAKSELINQIDDIIQKVPTDERTWLLEFKKMIAAEREIIERLNVPLSQINTDNLEHINSEDLKKHISNDIYGKFQKGLKDYLNMLKTFDFSQTVWEGRSFLGNPFEEFLEKVSSSNPEGLKARTLKDAFKKAATDVCKAKNAILTTMASFKKNLEPQNKKSQAVMIEIRYLNLLAVPNTEKKVKKSVSSLAKKLKTLQSAIENVNNIPPIFQCFMQKRAWLDEIRTQLRNIDQIHTDLKIKLSRI